MENKQKAVFLDRDGVINEPHAESSYVTKPEEFKLLPGVSKAIRYFREQGYLVIVVTNQQCVGLGLLTQQGLAEIHQRMRSLLADEGAILNDIFYCPHRAEENCPCRKPKPGMLIEASQKHSIDLTKSWMIGDSPRDIEAGRNAGCHTVYQGQVDSTLFETPPDQCAESLQEIMMII